MKNRNMVNKIKSNYAKLPCKIFNMGLSPGSIALYSYLLSNNEDFNPSIRWVSNNLNVSNNTVIKYYEELESKNIISCFFKGYKGAVSKWQFNNLDLWQINN